MSFIDLDFKVQGEPVALKRHRTTRAGEFNREYDPSAGDKQDFLVKAMQDKPEIPFDEPLHVRYLFCFPRPKSHYRSGKNSHMLKESAPHWHTNTPDADNLEKFVNDALNGIFWKDDKIICCPSIEKFYGDQPYIHIKVTKLDKFKQL